MSLYQPITGIWSMAAMLRDSTVAVAIMRTHPQAKLLPTITMRKSIHGFFSLYGYEAPLESSAISTIKNSLILGF